MSSSQHLFIKHPPAPNTPLKPPILLLHGWLGTHHDLNILIHPLTQLGHEVFQTDLPYHGSSIHITPPTLTAAANLLIQSLQSHLTQRPILLGYSMGGRLAFHLSTLHNLSQSRIRPCALILLSSSVPPVDKHAAQRIEISLATQLSATPAFAAWLDAWYRRPIWADFRSSASYQALISSRVKHSTIPGQLAAWAAATTSLGKSRMTRPEAPLQIPTLFVYGSLDAKHVAMCQDYERLCDRIQFCRVPHVGHHVLVERPSDVTHAIVRFLARFDTVTISGVWLSQYSLPLKSQIVVADQRISERTGMLIAVRSSAGVSGVGDICPLPGLHVEGMTRCIQDVAVLASRIRHSVSFSVETFEMADVNVLTAGLCASVKNAVECAVVHMMARSGNQELVPYLRTMAKRQFPGIVCSPLPYQAEISVNGVLPRLSNDATKRIASVEAFTQNSPFQTIKLKVGCLENLEEEIEIVNDAVLAAVGRGYRLRLDANRAWTKAQFDTFCNNVHDAGGVIEFIEEPLKSVTELCEYVNTSTTAGWLPVGLDESIAEYSLVQLEELATSHKCKAIIIKPSVVGSLESCVALASIGMRTSCATIMSTIFESGVGISWTTLLAAAFGEVTSHGLGTYAYLAKDVLKPSFEDHCTSEKTASVSVQKCYDFLDKAASCIIDSGEDILPKL